jgi:hypothetical protein
MRHEKRLNLTQSIKPERPQDLAEKIDCNLLLINDNDQKRSSSCVCSVTRQSGRHYTRPTEILAIKFYGGRRH